MIKFFVDHDEVYYPAATLLSVQVNIGNNVIEMRLRLSGGTVIYTHTYKGEMSEVAANLMKHAIVLSLPSDDGQIFDTERFYQIVRKFISKTRLDVNFYGN